MVTDHEITLCLFVTENSTLEKQDTFVEKLVTQIIKNLQVQISNIHVRYEDNVSIVQISVHHIESVQLKFGGVRSAAK